MTWNWQQRDWPNFFWDRSRFIAAEAQFLVEAGVLAGTLRHLTPPDREQLAIDAMSTEAVTTSEIEGEILDRASVQSSIRRHLGLSTERPSAKPAEAGIAEMMVDMFQHSSDPLDRSTLFRWHSMLLQGRRDIRDIGRYRVGEEPMQVISGATYAPKIHFEAPPSSAVPEQMAGFFDWYRRTAPGGLDPLPPMMRSAIAHLYFVSIHPFEDGNGRIARAVSEKVLAESLHRPSLVSLASTILVRRRSYYDALEAANKTNEVTTWVGWFSTVVIEAQRRSIANIDFLIDKARLLDRMRGQLNGRQEKALLRMLREGPEGFKGGLSASNYAAITGASSATTTRDLSDLVEKGALTRTGERRHARYQITIPLRRVSRVDLL
ncbi:MAG: Fic family protein [Bryobacterales bacterium]|nr:Fic family protein [Bryobacterales bacterium]